MSQLPLVTPFFGDSSKQDKDSKDKAKLPSVPADETQTMCPQCGERFEQYFDSEQDEWMYRDTVRLDGVIYHQKCSVSQEPQEPVMPVIQRIATPPIPLEIKEESKPLVEPQAHDDVSNQVRDSLYIHFCRTAVRRAKCWKENQKNHA